MYLSVEIDADSMNILLKYHTKGFGYIEECGKKGLEMLIKLYPRIFSQCLMSVKYVVCIEMLDNLQIYIKNRMHIT